MAVLRSTQILQEKNTNDPNSVTSLSLTHKALTDVSCLGEFKNLERLDLSFNSLTSLEGLKSCQNLKWLSVANNKLESLKGIETLTKILVLNAGKNKLKSMSEVGSLVGLRALILNDNEIVSICKLDQMKDLNTLVLSRNPVCEIGESLAKAKSMTKLSLSNCQLGKIGSSLKSCTELKELRLAHNDIKTLPEELVHNRKLQNLDVGNNLITKGSDLKVLTSLIYLKTLNLQGNPIAEKESLAKKVKKMLPNLKVFNTKLTEKRNKKESDVLDSPDYKGKPGVRKDIDMDASSVPKKSKKHLLGDQSTDMLMSNLRDQEVKGSSSKKQKTNEQLYKERSDQMETSIVDSQSKKKLKKLQDNGINISENVELPGEDPDVTIEAKRKKDKAGKRINDKAIDIYDNTDIVEKALVKKSKGKVKSRESKVLDHDKMDVDDANESIDKKFVQNSNASVVIDKKKGKNKKKRMAAEALLFSPDAEVGLGGPSTWDA
ncbi:hypothetical protein LIER_07497 [Lithospermum erythrorhizon]|uniref:Uncharacterized protein n=1 Tax=Lithospermum erythrorhizon TaxID=34254 RepID=A0AAV3P8C8_LITER